MNRRGFIALFGGALSAVLVCNATLLWAQTSTDSLRRVGVLGAMTQAKVEIFLKPFFDQMRELGWIEGKNVAYNRLYADDQIERLPALAAELVARRPEVIYAPPTPAAMAAKQATQTIPIVFAIVADPVGGGLVTSLARPGGNVTGISVSSSDAIGSKWFQWLREIRPGVKRIGSLWDSNDPQIKSDRQRRAQPQRAARLASLGITFHEAEAANPVEFEAAVARLLAERVEVIFVSGIGVLANIMRTRLIELANQKRVPVIASASHLSDAGALFTYGPAYSPLDNPIRNSALLVDKILKGAKPADLPVEQPIKFELVVNMKTAKALGITVPHSVLISADRVIE